MNRPSAPPLVGIRGRFSKVRPWRLRIAQLFGGLRGGDVKRIHLLEIADLAWCPRGIRQGVNDYCRFLVELGGVFNPVAPLLAEALRRTGARQILDLGSGAAGPWLGLLPRLRELGIDAPVCLSDRYPDLEAFERVSRISERAIAYHSEPVDAAQVPDRHLGELRLRRHRDPPGPVAGE